MLDVHPPHHAASTWRDFFIHIATIVIGLLIAIGLEQTVEYVHHRHERRVLIEEMQAEAERTVQVLDSDVTSFNSEIRRIDLELQALAQAKITGQRATGKLPGALPQAAAGSYPPRSVWPIAKANGTAALLPENLSEIYTRLDYEADQFLVGQGELSQARDAHSALIFRLRLKDFQPGAEYRMSVAERDELARALSVLEAKLAHENAYVAVWDGAADAVVHHVASRDDMVPFMRRHLAALQ